MQVFLKVKLFAYSCASELWSILTQDSAVDWVSKGAMDVLQKPVLLVLKTEQDPECIKRSKI
jgi:hypothetical protein